MGKEHTVGGRTGRGCGERRFLTGVTPVRSDSCLMAFISAPLGTVESHSYDLHVGFEDSDLY